MIVGAAVSHNFGLAGAADSVAEDGTYVVGGIGTAGMAAVAIGFAGTACHHGDPICRKRSCIA